METSNCKYSKQGKNIHWGNPRLLATVQLSTSVLQVITDFFQLKKILLEDFFYADKSEINVQKDNGIGNSFFDIQTWYFKSRIDWSQTNFEWSDIRKWNGFWAANIFY